MAAQTHLLAQQIRDKVDNSAAKGRWSDFQWVSETASTNKDLIDVAQKNGPAGVLLADFQTAGQGRCNRSWVTKPGEAILMSLALKGLQPLEAASTLSTFAASVALVLNRFCDQQVQIKWPNDLVVGHRKLAGVLAQYGSETLVIGMGLNVFSVPEEVLVANTRAASNLNQNQGSPTFADSSRVGRAGRAEGAGEAERAGGAGRASGAGEVRDSSALAPICLKEIAGSTQLDRADIAADILISFDNLLKKPARMQRELVAQNSATLNKRVRVIEADREITGVAIRFDDNGALVVQSAAGQSTHFAGDVVHLRPYEV